MTYKAIAYISLITAMQASNACTCAETYDKRFMDAFEHIVVATIVSKSTVYADKRHYKLAIRDVIKGDGKITVVYTDTRSTCTVNFREGESYVLFTKAAPKNKISICSSQRLRGAPIKRNLSESKQDKRVQSSHELQPLRQIRFTF